MVKISTSILSYSDTNIITKLNKTDTDYLHIDVMDGNFVDNEAFLLEEIRKIDSISSKPLDIHLMVENVEQYIAELSHLDIEYITFHYESNYNLDIIKKIKNLGIKCGISVKPITDIKEIFHLLDKVDLILIMSVEPGYSGQTFIEETLEKIEKLKKEIVQKKLNTLISVDGGVNEEHASRCIQKGADMLVSNTFIINSNNFQDRISSLRGIAEKTVRQ